MAGGRLKLQTVLLKDKLCLIVGASSGMGRQTAFEAANQGAHVVLAARRIEDCKAAAQTIIESGGKALALKIDGTDQTSVNKAIDLIRSRYGKLDCVFNNLGAVFGTSVLHETPLERWKKALNVNLTSVFMLMKAQIPLLLESGGGVIVNNTSIAGLKGEATFADYSVAKWALVGLTRTVALEYAAQNIRCLSIAPGTIMTEKAQEMATQMPDVFAHLGSVIPLHRTGEMNEIASVVSFLMSDLAKYITGVTVPIDGGRLA